MRKRSDPNRASWLEQLALLKSDIELMPPGPDRDAASRRAQQLETAIQMDGWLKSTELKPPS